MEAESTKLKQYYSAIKNCGDKLHVQYCLIVCEGLYLGMLI